jgi:hypothetical protein
VAPGIDVRCADLPSSTRRPIAALISLVMSACAASHTDVVPIPIDYGGFAGRLRRLCDMGKAAAAEGACATETVAADDAGSPAEQEDADGGVEPREDALDVPSDATGESAAADT